ncbi:MAG: cytochrome b N-terminal domain-containing protein [Candidatus Kapabacteria bacterium]|nr:cytochrome b N-terminal domain-containing protein [Candidatus Kapabacteria bacterium]
MSETWATRLKMFSHGIAALIFLLIAVQAVTGLLLSMFYVPSRAPVLLASGEKATIVNSERIEKIGSFTDTLGMNGGAALIPASNNDVVPSEAAASVVVDIANAPAGNIIRSIHHNNTGWLYGLGIIWLIILVVRKAYKSEASVWVRAVFFLVLVLVCAWSGRLLPDDVYAEISRRIVGNELQEAPFGNFISSIFGVDPSFPRLNRTFVMHVFAGGLMLLMLLKPFSSRKGAIPVAFVLAFLLAVSAFIPLDALAVRDTMTALDGSAHVQPWWVISPLHTLVEWVGAELAGYMLIAALTSMLMLSRSGWGRKL